MNCNSQNAGLFLDGIGGFVSPKIQCGNKYFIQLMQANRERTREKEINVTFGETPLDEGLADAETST